MSDGKGNIVKDFFTVDRLGKVGYSQYFISNFTVWFEVNVWVLTAGRTERIKLDFFQCTFSGSCLLGFGSIGTESLDKVLQFLNLFFLLFVGFLHLFDHQLAGFIPEVVVSGIKLHFCVVDVNGMCTYFV